MNKPWSLLLLATLLLSACDMPDAEQRRQAMHLPPLGFKGDAAEGKVIFKQHCVSCHGEQGRGSYRGPPLIHGIYRADHHADLAFHLAAGKGVKQHHWKFGDMPPQPHITPEQMAHIIAYVRREQQHADLTKQ